MGGRGIRNPPPQIREVRQEAIERREEMPAAEEEERDGGNTDGETPRGATGEVIRMGRGIAPPRGKLGSTWLHT